MGIAVPFLMCLALRNAFTSTAVSSAIASFVRSNCNEGVARFPLHCFS